MHISPLKSAINVKLPFFVKEIKFHSRFEGFRHRGFGCVWFCGRLKSYQPEEKGEETINTLRTAKITHNFHYAAKTT